MSYKPSRRPSNLRLNPIRPVCLVVCTCAAAVLVTAACTKHDFTSATPPGGAAMSGAPGAGPSGGAPMGPMPVDVITVKPTRIKVMQALSGRLSATQVSDVRPQVDGIIQKRLFVEGSNVTKGQPLYQLDPSSYQAAYDTARGTLAKAVATYQAAAITAKRYLALSQIKGVSTQDTENYIAAAEEDKADVLSDQGTLETARINLQRTLIKCKHLSSTVANFVDDGGRRG